MLNINSTHEHFEYRAPTDASVKLLKDFERLAEERIIASIKLDTNDFKCVIYHQLSPIYHLHEYVIVYELNEVRHTVRYDAHDHKTKDDIICDIRDAVAKDIANHIVGKALYNSYSKFNSILPE